MVEKINGVVFIIVKSKTGAWCLYIVVLGVIDAEIFIILFVCDRHSLYYIFYRVLYILLSVIYNIISFI